MKTPPRTPETRRRGANGRFLPRGADSFPRGTDSSDAQGNGAGNTAGHRSAAGTDPPDPRADDPTATEHVMSDMTEIIDSDGGAAVDGPAPSRELPEDRFLNRELSWLDFNARVLAL